MRHIEKACNMLQESNNYKHILEFGVYEGKTISIIKNTVSSDYKIYGFDSFEGLPEDWKSDAGLIAGDGRCVKGCFSLNGNIPIIEGLELYKGWFNDTLPEYLKIAEPISLLHVDCDLYSSTKTVLYGLNDYIKEGSIIVFDEWFYNHNPMDNDHEQKCFYEWVKDYNREFELISYNDDCEQKIVKILK